MMISAFLLSHSNSLRMAIPSISQNSSRSAIIKQDLVPIESWFSPMLGAIETSNSTSTDYPTYGTPFHQLT